MNEKKGRSKKKKFIYIGLFILLLAVIIYFNLQAQREKAVKVTVAEVNKQNLTSIVSASGEIKPKKNVNISAQIPGRIIKIGVEEGQPTQKNDFLLKLDSSQYEAEVARNQALINSYKADLIRAEAVLKRDESLYERQKRLYEEELISLEQLEAARTQYEVSKSQYQAYLFQIKQAEAALQSSLDNLSKTVYNAPIDGIITSLRVEEGEISLVGTMNNPGTVLMTIADLSVMQVEVEVDETDVVGVEIGQKAEVRVDALPNQIIEGTVTEIGSSALQTVTTTQESKDFKVVITLKGPPPLLKPGLSASADIITAEKKDVLAVPISALVIKEVKETEAGEKTVEKEGIFAVDKDQRVRFMPVEKGIMGELSIEIKRGLSEGDTVVVGPFSSLRQLEEGMLINPEKKE
ncbi:MAG: efflux RND transporter periplasmic adaptor subunit [Acidobacteriota bacterium]